MVLKKIYPAFAVVLSVMLLLINNVTIFAISGSEIDMDQTGSISITIKYDDEPVAGGSLTLYKVASISLDDGNLSYLPTSEFEGFESDFSDALDSKLADELKDYVDEKKLEGTIKEFDDNGKISYEGLELGLYLMIQREAADGFYELNPFLVSVPGETEDGIVLYNVDASPKVEIVAKPGELVEPETTVEEETTKQPEDTPSGISAPSSVPTPSTPVITIPQTGLLIWPVILLAMVGILLIAIGWRIKMPSKLNMRSNNEA